MVDYKYKGLFLKSHVDKQLKIATDDGSFAATNEDIHFEDFELTESLCSDFELRFGSCEASIVKFQIRNAFIPLSGKWLTVTETLNGNIDVPFQYGRYKVFSDVPTADKEYRDIVAYDAMYDILGADVTAWYNSILPNKDSTATLKRFRESFVRHFGLTESLPKIGEDNAGNPVYGLANDTMTVERTIDPEYISGKDIITAICEINGCFGHIGRDGKFHFIYLPQNIQGIYPANFLYPDHVPAQWDYLPQAETGHLYPQDPKGERMGAGRYKKCQYEDYVVRQINKLRIRKEENDIGATYPDTEPNDKDNLYVIEDNFLVYGKSAADLQTIAENIYSKITGIVYRPFNADCVGNPCMEVGDSVRLPTKYAIVESYILKRNLKGIQELRGSYTANGTEKYVEKLNGVQKSIIQLKGKANILTRTIEETKLEMYDISEGLSNAITVTARDIRAELKDTENSLESSINQTASQIRTEVSNADQNLQSQITQNAGEIALRVTKDGVVSAINLSPESVTIKADRIDLQGLVNAQELTAKFATISTLNAVEARVGSIESDYASVGELNAESAILQNMISERATIGQLEAVNGKFDNLNADNITSGTLNVNRLDLDYLFGQEISGRVINVNTLIAAMRVSAERSMNAPEIYCDSLNGHGIGWETITIGGKSYTVLTG